MHPTHWLISTQACATRDADGNAPLHFALVRCAAAEVVDVLVRARPGACGQRGFLGRLPLQLARLYGAAPSTLEVLTDAYPGAADCDKPAITQRTTPRTRPSKRKGAAARRPSKRVARTVTPGVESTSTPSTRRLLDGVAMLVSHRSTGPGRIIAEK